jgi:YHS domain-containing protein
MRHMVKDPVCGQDIDREEAVTWSYEGELYYLCAETLSPGRVLRGRLQK